MRAGDPGPTAQGGIVAEYAPAPGGGTVPNALERQQPASGEPFTVFESLQPAPKEHRVCRCPPRHPRTRGGGQRAVVALETGEPGRSLAGCLRVGRIASRRVGIVAACLQPGRPGPWARRPASRRHDSPRLIPGLVGRVTLDGHFPAIACSPIETPRAEEPVPRRVARRAHKDPRSQSWRNAAPLVLVRTTRNIVPTIGAPARRVVPLNRVPRIFDRTGVHDLGFG